MTAKWVDFVSVLGKAVDSPCMRNLLDRLEQSPVVSVDPDSYGDEARRTVYWEFFDAGIQIGVREGVVAFIYFFFGRQGGYSEYTGQLPSSLIRKGLGQDQVVAKLGPPSRQAASKVDGLLGVLNAWVSYDLPECVVRFEFSGSNELVLIALLKY